MQAQIINFRSIGDTTIEINPIALVCGLNGAGKTSIARAIAAAATGKAVPYDKVTKKDCGKMLLRHGTHAGNVVFGGDDGTTQVSWPKAEVNTTGIPPQASEIACGLVDLLAMKEKEAIGYLIKLLRAEPTKSDVISALEAQGIEAAVGEKIWQVIEAQGIEAAHKRAVETGQQRKGAWSQITGTAWGDEKAREWYPEGWEDSFADVPEATLQEAVEIAQARLEELIAKNAVSKAEYDRLSTLAGQIEELIAGMEEAAQKVADAKVAIEEIDKTLAVTPDPHAKDDYECPYCAEPLQVNAITPNKFAIVKAAKSDGKKKKGSATEYASLCGKKSRLDAEYSAASNAHRAAMQKHAEAIEAAEKVKSILPSENEDQIVDARLALSTAKSRLELVSRCKSAQVAMQQVFTNQKIVSLLSETGIRKKKLGDCLDSFIASYIDPLCNDFGIPVASLDMDMNITVGTTSYQMLSESEQFRVRTVFQIAIAQIEKASVIIIDRADILDKSGRTRLFTTVINAGLPAVICMTLNSPEQAPNLAASGHGVTYWLEKGQCRAVAGKAAA